MRNKKNLIVAGIAITLFAGLFAWFDREMMIDKCLDSGGAWDYAKVICDNE